jgi:hypothetical protein
LLAAALPSSAHTYRLLFFKEPFPASAFTSLRFAANRFVRQQQRDEIMQHLLQLVNNFIENF